MDDKLKSMKFRILCHMTKGGTMRRGYHCPTCGMFYADGNYTIESDTIILGRIMRVFCCTERELAVPHLFEDVYEARAYIKEINMNLNGLRALFINKASIASALFNPSAILEYRKKHSH